MARVANLLRTNWFISGLVIFLLFWIWLIKPQILRLPKDFSYQAEVISVDNPYDETALEFKGERYSKTDFNYQVIGRQGRILEIRNTFDVKTLDGKQIFKAEPVYGIDAMNGRHVAGFGDKDRQGYLFAPRGLRKDQSFDFWHPSTDRPLHMKFVGEEYLHGLKVYKYEKENTEAFDQTSLMTFLPGVPEERGIKLASNVFAWFEPVSGYLVKMDDFSTDYFYFDIKTGERIHPYNKFTNVYSERSIREHVQQAIREKNMVLFIVYGVPLLILIWVIVLLLMKFNLPLVVKTTAYLKERRIELLVLLIAIVASLTGFWFVSKYVNSLRSAQLELESHEVSQLIESRVDNFVAVLLGARGFLEGSSEVTRTDWRDYVRALDIENYFKGVQGVGYAKVVLPAEKSAFEQTVRAEGFPNFTIRTIESRPLYTSIVYLEPFNERNQRAFGYDMFSEETRRKAMTLARDSGAPAASGRVTLLQEKDTNVQPGFLIYVPAYLRGSSAVTIDDRVKNIIGYVYSPFRIGDFMDGVLGEKRFDLEFHVYDGLIVNVTNQIFDYPINSHGDSGKNTIFRKVETIYIAGHPWTIEYLGYDKEWTGSIEDWLVYLVLVAGLITSGLLWGMVRVIVQSQKKAVAFADKATKDLQHNLEKISEEKKRLQAVELDLKTRAKGLEGKLEEVEKINESMIDREKKMIELKDKISQLESKLGDQKNKGY